MGDGSGVSVKSVRLWDMIQFDSDTWQVVAHDGPTLALKSLTTNRIRKVAVSVLLGDDSYLPATPDARPDMTGLDVYATLDPSAASRVRFLHRHVHEVLHGSPCSPQPRRHRRCRGAGGPS